MGEEGISDRCWNKFEQVSVFALYSPYIICLAAEDLNLQSFCDSINQEIFFLNAFAKAYETHIDCTEDEKEREKLKELRDSVRDKIRLYGHHVKKSGFQLRKQRKIQEATLEFNNFLHDKATMERKVAKSCTLAAIAVNRKLYHHLHSSVASSSGTTNMYEYWINYYTSDSFKDLVRENDAALDFLSCPPRGDTRVKEEVERTYRDAMHLMVRFFLKIPVEKQSSIPLSQLHHRDHHLHIFSDYDMACSARDSSFLLAEAKMNKSVDSAVWDERWRELRNQHTMEVEQCLNVITEEKEQEKKKREENNGDENSGEEEGFNLTGFIKALKKIAECEKKAYNRVIQSSLLKELSVDDVKEIARTAALKDDCKTFLKRIAERGSANISLHFISCCWCSELIRSTFSDLSAGLNAVNIHSNDLDYTEESMTTGGIKTNVVSAYDKVNLLFEEKLKNGDFVSTEEENYEEHMNVYIGGDMVDLLCLHEANVGIVINPGQNIMKLGGLFGVKFVPLFGGLVKKQTELRLLERKKLKELCLGEKQKKQKELCSVEKQKELCLVQKNEVWESHSDTVYTVSCWEEIEAFIFGL